MIRSISPLYLSVLGRNRIAAVKNTRLFSTTLLNSLPHQKNVYYDLQSDTSTEPTDEMFDIMKAATRGDDVFSVDTTINNLEAHVAAMLGHESSLFCTSGTLSNQLGLRLLLTQPPHSVLCDARAHIFNYECGGVAYHSQASIMPVIPSNGHHLTVHDIESNLMADTICSPVTKVVSLENTLNGTIMPLDEIKRIRELCVSKGIKLHLDGARLWNASQATEIPLHTYGQYFDTISVCLSKGLGAPVGSMLVSSSKNIRRARFLRKLMGGGWRQAGFVAAAAQHCIDTVLPTLPETHRMTRQLADAFVALGMELTVPCETNMVFVDTEKAGVTVIEVQRVLKEKGILIAADEGSTQTRIVLHYQVTQEAVDRVIKTVTELVEKKRTAVDNTSRPAEVLEMGDTIRSGKPFYPSPGKSKSQ